MFLNIFKVSMHLEKKLFQLNEYNRMDVDQNTFRDPIIPIIIITLIHGKPVGATEYK
jgi:hypothetical protein